MRYMGHQEERRIEAHIFVAFMAYALHVTLRQRLHALAPGLTPRAVLEKFSVVQMIDVHLPTTDGCRVIISRYTQPEDVMTQSRHNSNKELMGQGFGNIVSSLVGGIPGSGTTGPTLVNVASGGQTRLSGVFAGVFAGLVLLLLGKLMAWIPLGALAGVLIVIAGRMLDKNSLQLLKHRSTIFDFLVILAVVISTVSMSLIVAAGVGTALAIVLFLREQIRSSVVRRKFFGNQKFSKKRRITAELSILESQGKGTIICELQGQLFFGTTDQLFTELESHLAQCSFVVLDMRRVQSLDFTAANMLKQIHNRVKKKQDYLVLASIPLSLPTGRNVKAYLATPAVD